MVSRALARNSSVSEVLVHTGQHYDVNMSNIFFAELEIPTPKYNLNINSGSHGAMTGAMLVALEQVMKHEKPDWVLVYGDTNSTLAGALAAAKLHIPIAHVEAGLRSFNKKMPEEINRILTDHVSSMLFVPTKSATQNLLNEGIDESCINFVGDVMYDVTLFFKNKAQKPEWFDNLKVLPGEYVLATVHRAENTDDVHRLQSIFSGLGDSGKFIIMPLHPRTRLKIQDFGIKISENILIVDPVGYLQMIWLQENCLLIATDSGGVQKEAYFHNKPCITLRDETEWIELVESGWNKVVGCNPKSIVSSINSAKIPESISFGFYGDGNAALCIAKTFSTL
jgi:UDP-GlcNAc3NAcA epimerase